LNEVGVVAALEAEARTLGPKVPRGGGLSILNDGGLLAVSGMGGGLAAIAARNLIGAGAKSLMSFGLAGGLDPRLKAGSVVLPGEVISREGGRFITTQTWCEQLRPALEKRLEVVSGRLLSTAQPVDAVADKAALFLETGAAAVDMESMSIAAVAAAYGLPFIAVRVIVDTAFDVLPGAVLAASRGGEVNVLRLILRLAAKPKDLIPLLHLARRYRAATRSLRAIAGARRAIAGARAA
jgi:adenosylhomocysteine nucleosidase